MKNPLLHILLSICLTAICGQTVAAGSSCFRRIGISDGLSDSQVNCIFKDSQGFMWFGTGMGLSRYDGFRFRNFYHSAADSTTILSNLVTQVMESADHRLWVSTDQGYCIYDPATERFERRPDRWMAANGMTGGPEHVFVDSKGNLLILSYVHGLWYKNFKTGAATQMPFGGGEGCIPQGTITSVAERGRSLVLTYNDGLMVRINPEQKRVVWINDYPRRALSGNDKAGFYTYIDSEYNYYVYTNGHSMVYSSRDKRWFDDIAYFLSYRGVDCKGGSFLVKQLQQAPDGNLWIATEHRGLLCVNLRLRTMQDYTYDPLNPLSLPDNTPQCTFIESSGAMWIGSLRNGAAYWSQKQTRFATVPVGDICTMTEDKQGVIWMGTNDQGIITYDPRTGATRHYGRQETGLGSDVVVSSLCSRDGTLWFGTYNGGMACYRNGRFTAIKASAGGLGVNSVWSLAEDYDGHIVIGTLGSGLQLMDKMTLRFVATFNTHNSQLSSDYIASIFVCSDGRLLAGHSQNFSFVNGRTGKIDNYPTTVKGEAFASRAVNQIMQDSRGLIWCANMSGLNVYDPRTDSLYTLTDNSQMACAVVEDKSGSVWVTLSHGVARFNVSRGRQGVQFQSTSFDMLDGLQSRRFNYRSILATTRGDVIIGGQDGVNIIATNVALAAAERAKALFSGLILFDRPLNVGEEYGGRVVLEQSVNTSRSLRLRYSENAFTVLLASDHVSVPQKVRFMYRLDGFNDEQWLTTAEGQPTITYTNLSPGSYTLQVKVVNRDGSVSPDTSTLKIVIDPPFWLTGWAYLIYALLIGVAAWVIWRMTIHRQLVRMRIEQIQKEAERNRKLDEMKLNFFAKVSHELRTPLTLIISPVKLLLNKETDPTKRTMFSMILRNANRLLDLVNQTIDLRRIDKDKAELNLGNGDVVRFLSDLCHTFKTLSGRGVDIVFTTQQDSLAMSFDDDKLEKIVTNLIANALKFTPDGGRISVGLTLNTTGTEAADGHGDTVEITVADTGSGISDEDKSHIFDMFYQARNDGGRMIGGSGIGLSLVKEFSQLHGGDVSVGDNPGGGTVFTVTLPYRFDPSLPAIRADLIQQQAEDTAVQGIQYAGDRRDDDENIAVDSMNSLLKKGEYEVLVVDDNPDFLEFMSAQLSETYTVSTALNGREALRMIHKRRPDIILSDVMMPEMDGNELCRILKSDPKTERIPFVMLTARLSAEHKIEGLTNGADDYLTKPFSFDLLNLRIANLIKWHNATPVGEKIDPKIKQQQITSVDEKLVQDATKYVEDNLTSPSLSVDAMADALMMSRVRLYKRLLSITGSTPTEFIRTIRLRHAADLLKNGGFNVSEVAYKVGFNNPRYFSRYFNEMYGCMPSQYRKSGDDKNNE